MLARDWRAGELRVLAMALVIAVAAVTSVAFFADRVGQALARDAHQLLGADVVLASDHPWKGQMEEDIRARGLEAAAAVNFISMAFGGDKSQLAGVKAVTGTIRCAGACASRRRRGADAPARARPAQGHGVARGAAGRRARRRRWARASGSDAPSSRWRRSSRSSPSERANFFNIAPRLLMNLTISPATGLIQTGAACLLPVCRRRASTSRGVRIVCETPAGTRPARRQSRDRTARGARLGRARAAVLSR
jgi:putative ABC transport system permease protein